MSQIETLLEEAILQAQSKGILIRRRALFDWTAGYDKPVACCALGAVLLHLGKENLVKKEFDKSWLDVVCSYLGVNSFWIYRFCIGFDNNNQITFTTVDKNGKERQEKDEISKLGIRLAAKYC